MRVGFAIPGPIETALSGGYLYDRALIAHAPALGVELVPLELPRGFPFPDGVPAQAIADTAAVLAAWGGPLLIDGLAFGAFPDALARKIGPRATALVHHPLAFESGLAPDQAARLRASERAALASAVGVVATSAVTAEALTTEFGVPADRIVAAPPGFARGPRAPMISTPPVILAVGAAIRRKRFPELIDALATLADLDWRCRLIGPTDVDPVETARLQERVAAARRLGVEDRFDISGAVPKEALDAAYLGAHLFVSAAAYEGYGMAIAEAALHGLPIVAVAGGAARETAAHGVLIDARLDGAALEAALAAAMRPLLADPSARHAASARVWAARDMILTPEATAARVVGALRRFFE